MRKHRFVVLYVLLVFLIGFLVYGQSLFNGYVYFDDVQFIVDNPLVHAITFRTIWHTFTSFHPELYTPLAIASYQIDHLIGGLHPFMYHLTNLLLHIINAFLAGWFAWLLLQRQRKPKIYHIQWIAIVVSLLFLLHPIQTETVAWLAERKGLLSTTFYLGALIAYLKYLDSDKRRTYIICFYFFILGLLSKVMVAMLPMVFVLIDYYCKRPFTAWSVREKTPFFILSILFVVVGIYGELDVVRDVSVSTMLLMAPKSIIFYLQHLFWPTGLTILHPYTQKVSILSPGFFLPLLLVAVLVAVTIWQGKKHRLVGFCIGFFLVTLIPTFLNYSWDGDIYTAAERYAYVPSLGIFLLVALQLFQITKKQQWNIRWALSVISIVLLSLGIKTYHQSLTWKNPETLAHTVLRQHPESYLAYDMLGVHYKSQEEYNDALEALLTASTYRTDSVRVWTNLGSVYGALGQYDRERWAYERGKEVDPSYLPLRYNLALLHLDNEEMEEALKQYEAIVISDPDFLDARVRLADLWLVMGFPERAKELYVQEFEHNPNSEAAAAGLLRAAKSHVRGGRSLEEWML